MKNQNNLKIFYTICKPENLIYQSSKSMDLLEASMTAKIILKKAKPNFETERDTSFRSNPESTDFNKDLLGRIVSKICSLVPVNHIYRLGHSEKDTFITGLYQSDGLKSVKIHHYLLVICDSPCNPEYFNVQSIINQDENIKSTVTLLMHSSKDVQQALLDSNRFFHAALKNGEQLYTRAGDAKEPAIPEYDEKKALLNKTQLWYSRRNRAEALIEAAANVTEEEDGVVMVSMLSQAMVQICLAFIAERIGYRPNQLYLTQLFAVCRMIEPSIDEVFPISTEDDQRVFQLLTDGDRTLRYRVSVCIDPTDQGLLFRRCMAWMKKVKAVCTTQS